MCISGLGVTAAGEIRKMVPLALHRYSSPLASVPNEVMLPSAAPSSAVWSMMPVAVASPVPGASDSDSDHTRPEP